MIKIIHIPLCVLLISLLSGCGSFNEDGELNLETSSYEEEITFSEIEWPDTEIAQFVPIPKSNIGNISWSEDYGFVIYISGMTLDDFADYVDECEDAGFTINGNHGEDFFWADNEYGYHLHITYDKNNIMFIRIDEPKDGPNISTDTEEEETEEPITVEKEPEPTEKSVKETEVVGNLTMENCTELKDLLQNESNASASMIFASDYSGKTIEFDGCIMDVQNHGDYDTRYDILLYAGDYNETNIKGPSFQFYDVGVYSLGVSSLTLPGFISTGTNVHITAEVDEYISSSDIFRLYPISVEER